MIYILYCNSGADYLSVTEQRCSLFSCLLLENNSDFLPGIVHVALASIFRHYITYVAIMCIFRAHLHDSRLKTSQLEMGSWGFQPTHRGNVNELASYNNQRPIVSRITIISGKSAIVLIVNCRCAVLEWKARIRPLL